MAKELKLSVGSLSLKKGEVRKGITLYAWDTVPDCSLEQCVMFTRCQLPKDSKCPVLLDYLRVLYKSIFTTYPYMDETMLFKLGMQIIPLYVHLAKLQIVEMSLGSPMMEDEKGKPYVHPVYGEIRKTLQTTHMMWKDLHMTFEFPFKAKNPKDIEMGKDDGRGDPGYYKSIAADNKSMKGVVR